jgi:hypothetical protein
MNQSTINYTKIFHPKAFQNIPNVPFLVCKYTHHLATLSQRREKEERDSNELAMRFPLGPKQLFGIETGWPDWANFCPMDDCLLWAVF